MNIDNTFIFPIFMVLIIIFSVFCVWTAKNLNKGLKTFFGIFGVLFCFLFAYIFYVNFHGEINPLMAIALLYMVLVCVMLLVKYF